MLGITSLALISEVQSLGLLMSAQVWSKVVKAALRFPRLAPKGGHI